MRNLNYLAAAAIALFGGQTMSPAVASDASLCQAMLKDGLTERYFSLYTSESTEISKSQMCNRINKSSQKNIAGSYGIYGGSASEMKTLSSTYCSQNFSQRNLSEQEIKDIKSLNTDLAREYNQCISMFQSGARIEIAVVSRDYLGKTIFEITARDNAYDSRTPSVTVRQDGFKCEFDGVHYESGSRFELTGRDTFPENQTRVLVCDREPENNGDYKKATISLNRNIYPSGSVLALTYPSYPPSIPKLSKVYVQMSDYGGQKTEDFNIEQCKARSSFKATNYNGEEVVCQLTYDERWNDCNVSAKNATQDRSAPYDAFSSKLGGNGGVFCTVYKREFIE